MNDGAEFVFFLYKKYRTYSLFTLTHFKTSLVSPERNMVLREKIKMNSCLKTLKPYTEICSKFGSTDFFRQKLKRVRHGENRTY